MSGQRHVIVVGGGFAGLGCVRTLAARDNVHVTLIDQHNYHQFQPLLYQVATCQLAPSHAAFSLRKLFHRPNVDVKMAEVVAIDPDRRTVTAADGQTWTGDNVVLAAGSRPNFFATPGAERHAFPLYSLRDAQRLRSRIIGTFEQADRDPRLIEQGALNFVVVGGGATGVECAGALADMIGETMTLEYRDLAVTGAQVHIVDHGHALLGPFSSRAHDYAAEVLRRKQVQIHLGVAVTEVGAGHVTLADGTVIRTRCVVWGGGIQAPAIAAAAGLPVGQGGRVAVQPDLTVEGAPGIYAVGDVASIPAPDGGTRPQLGSVALQSGAWAATNIIMNLEGGPRAPFRYRDKGVMAMIGRGAAVAALGPRRREIHGPPAFAAWLGVHAMLMTGSRNRVEAILDWGWDYFSRTRGPQVLDRAEAADIDWTEDGAAERSPVGAGTPSG
jgi:NADH:ubiquinone reductase (H+-translocating)